MPGSRASFESFFGVRERLRPLPAPRVPGASSSRTPQSPPPAKASAYCRRSAEQGDDPPLAAGAVERMVGKLSGYGGRVPAPPSIRRLSLAALDQSALDELVRHGEDLLVERKQDLPKPPRFGAAAGSFANTLGGWILLGVADDGEVHGWIKPERLDLQSYLGSVLASQVDPLPPFVADMRTVDGKPIGVIRVFASADVPHIVRGTGAVYVRSSKGKEPVDDHRTLLDLARRGEEAELRARQRLFELPPVGWALRPPDWRPPGVVFGEEVDVRYIVRAAPLTVTAALAEWPLTRPAAESLVEMADVLPATPTSPPTIRASDTGYCAVRARRRGPGRTAHRDRQAGHRHARRGLRRDRRHRARSRCSRGTPDGAPKRHP